MASVTVRVGDSSVRIRSSATVWTKRDGLTGKRRTGLYAPLAVQALPSVEVAMKEMTPILRGKRGKETQFTVPRLCSPAGPMHIMRY